MVLSSFSTATPGRIVDHLENTRGFHLKTVKYLVMDEADRILNMDFEEEVDKLLAEIPKERTTYVVPASSRPCSVLVRPHSSVLFRLNFFRVRKEKLNCPHWLALYSLVLLNLRFFSSDICFQPP